MINVIDKLHVSQAYLAKAVKLCYVMTEGSVVSAQQVGAAEVRYRAQLRQRLVQNPERVQAVQLERTKSLFVSRDSSVASRAMRRTPNFQRFHIHNLCLRRLRNSPVKTTTKIHSPRRWGPDRTAAASHEHDVVFLDPVYHHQA